MTLTNQSAFDTMVNHLLKQGEKSRAYDRSTCLYRNPDGLKCAIGAILPDDLYVSSMENKLAQSLMHDYPTIGQLWENLSINLLAKMQYIHDNRAVSEWYDEFKAIADDFNLSMPEY